MTKFKRAYTMVLSFLCYERSTIRDCSDQSELPFPSLKHFKNQKIPIFQVEETIAINEDIYTDSV